MLLLSDIKMAWFGQKTGYERLADYVPSSFQRIPPSDSFTGRMFGKLASIALGHGRINQSASGRRVAAAWNMMVKREKLHILYGEDHLPYWQDLPSSLISRTIYTFHQPASQWADASIQSLRTTKAAILLYQRDLDFFTKAMGGNRIRFIHHGADVEFFWPGQPDMPPRLLYNGIHLRNVEMFERIVKVINERHPEVRIDALVPVHRRVGPVFDRLQANPTIIWHAGLNDEQLRALYQRAWLLLLPMNDSGANTAVVEALACGLPLVTTDVGGIRDYGGGSVYPLVPNNDDDGMIALVEQYLSQPAWRNEMGRACRQFAEETLAWPLIAQQHLKAYQELIV